MADLKTTFAGLTLKNPVIISSSGLTNSAAKNAKLEAAGAGAIVLKSLFEEQIMMEADRLRNPSYYPEGSDYLAEYIRNHKLAEYLELIKESIPLRGRWHRAAVTEGVDSSLFRSTVSEKIKCLQSATE